MFPPTVGWSNGSGNRLHDTRFVIVIKIDSLASFLSSSALNPNSLSLYPPSQSQCLENIIFWP